MMDNGNDDFLDNDDDNGESDYEIDKPAQQIPRAEISIPSCDHFR